MQRGIFTWPTCALRNAGVGSKAFTEYLIILVEYINLGTSESGCMLLIRLSVVGASL